MDEKIEELIRALNEAKEKIIEQQKIIHQLKDEIIALEQEINFFENF